jgi:hypothetical protein
MAFVCVAKAIMAIISLNEYARRVRHQVNGKDARECITFARTSQGLTALIWAASGGHTACVQALVTAKAALDIQGVSDARLFACPVTLESPSTSKSHKRLLKLVSCAAVCVCVCVCMCVGVLTNSNFVTFACIWMIVRSFCACTRLTLICVIYNSRLIISTRIYWDY